MREYFHAKCHNHLHLARRQITMEKLAHQTDNVDLSQNDHRNKEQLLIMGTACHIRRMDVITYRKQAKTNCQEI